MPVHYAMLIDRNRIRGLIPHAGSMCLLDAALTWDDLQIRCTATSHLDEDNPLRRNGRLGAVCALEYAAQAMALHGALTATDGHRSAGGLLAAARDLVLHRDRLDDCGSPLTVQAQRAMGDANRVIYEFRVSEPGGLVAEGRAAVVLDAANENAR